MRNENIEKIEYEKLRCKILAELPFGFFIAKHIKIEVEAGTSNPTTNEHLSNPRLSHQASLDDYQKQV